MPIFVQWKWKEKTKTFLVIFHLFDDFSKPNLRTKKRTICKDSTLRSLIFSASPDSSYFQRLIDKGFYDILLGEKTVTTWAPSHPELGYLAEVLRYANIIDGLSEVEKRDVRFDLELVVSNEDRKFALDEDRIKYLDERFAHKQKLFLYDDGIPALCCELCPEYIDYLQAVLKQYPR